MSGLDQRGDYIAGDKRRDCNMSFALCVRFFQLAVVARISDDGTSINNFVTTVLL